jgi:selenobiotic family peptide radical SAM maturase
MKEFCANKNVDGQIIFTGGNPFLYPDFDELYKEASDMGFIISILGNPVPEKRLKRIIEIQKPNFYQVSLEGLEEHNDEIRGKGHFQRTIKFLSLLRKLDVYSMVMLTLTGDNINQVLPLADFLRDKADIFHFNRLSAVGEGANLKMATPHEYSRFLEDYLKASEKNPVLGFKESLFNILYEKKGADFFGGCTGYGCGAAFNFFALLPDGEVHACRKFPSLIGNIKENSLVEIYDSDKAERYRMRNEECKSCKLMSVCGGCMAVSYSLGKDIFRQKDPYCFL